jgi:hypothetical protein
LSPDAPFSARSDVVYVSAPARFIPGSWKFPTTRTARSSERNGKFFAAASRTG